MFSALEDAQPQAVRYTSCRLPDGETFVAVLELEGMENSLPSIPAFVEFQEKLKTGWWSLRSQSS